METMWTCDECGEKNPELMHGCLNCGFPDLVPEFLHDMQEELMRAEKLHPPYNSYHEAYAVILEELDEFWEIVRMKTEARNPKDARDELIQIAVTAWRSSRDLDLEKK